MVGMGALATQSSEDCRRFHVGLARTDAVFGPGRLWRVRAWLTAADAGSTAFSIWFTDALLLSVPVALDRLGVATVVMLCFLAGAGLHTGSRCAIERMRSRIMAAAAFSAILFAGTGASGVFNIPAFVALLVTLTVAGFYAELAAIQMLQRRGLAQATALVVGSGAKAEALFRELRRRPALGLRPVAILAPVAHDDPPLSDATHEAIPTIANVDALPEPVDVVIAISPSSLVALEASTGKKAHEIANTLLLAEEATKQTLWLTTRCLGTAVGVQTHKAHRLDRSPQLKRAIDILLASAAAIPAAILTLLAALAVKIVDPGPAFFTQQRIGLGGRPIKILKIRTMYNDSHQRLTNHLDALPEARNEWEQRFKLVDDPRILPLVGSLLRRSSIDELPQIWNVLRGDMSMVGPRPFPDYHLDRFDDEFRSLRASVLPGLTGFWQISTRSDGDLEMQKADDLFYIRNRSIWLDLYILLQTVPAVVVGTGAR